MRKMLVFFVSFLTVISVMIGSCRYYSLSAASEPDIDAPSAILIEASSGRILYEKNADEKRHPASVTKVMTLLLVFEAIDSGKINMTDEVSVSENAASMGGSQIFLEVGETMSVEDMIKSVTVCSANDAAVALAEHVSGSEEAFVALMNKRAEELGMKNTHFENTNGLDDTTDTHLTSARDIAIMSRELLGHEKIFDYTTIWQDTVREGKFTLTNTNKLIRFYKGANGLKTGFTSKSGYCISASAKRDGMQLIAVIMGAESSDSRNVSAKKLFDYGFANYGYIEYPASEYKNIKVVGGVNESAKTGYNSFCDVIPKGDAASVKKEFFLDPEVKAPAEMGKVVGKVVYKTGDKVICEREIYLLEKVEALNFEKIFKKLLKNYFLL